ncbi:3630_t:CDS:2, partial [Cetraspora pellucida]
MAVSPDMIFSDEFCPVYPDQKGITFKVFATPYPKQRFCDELKIRKLIIELPDVHLKLD